MNLFLLRHGEAAPLRGKDADRQLTLRGREEVQSTLRQRCHRLPRLSTILSSPYIRARQTAAIVLEELDLESSVLVIDSALEPGASIDALISLLDCDPAEDQLIVSHQPLVGQLAAWLTDNPALSASFATATLAALELDYIGRGCARLNWQVHARQGS